MNVPVNTDQAEAVFENGVLTLTLPKAEESKPKTIEVKRK
jgi:HSP20 family protein